jgi:hypothetical protein
MKTTSDLTNLTTAILILRVQITEQVQMFFDDVFWLQKKRETKIFLI